MKPGLRTRDTFKTSWHSHSKLVRVYLQCPNRLGDEMWSFFKECLDGPVDKHARLARTGTWEHAFHAPLVAAPPPTPARASAGRSASRLTLQRCWARLPLQPTTRVRARLPPMAGSRRKRGERELRRMGSMGRDRQPPCSPGPAFLAAASRARVTSRRWS